MRPVYVTGDVHTAHDLECWYLQVARDVDYTQRGILWLYGTRGQLKSVKYDNIASRAWLKYRKSNTERCSHHRKDVKYDPTIKGERL